MKSLEDRCAEAIRLEILKEFEGKRFSRTNQGNFYLNEHSGGCRVKDAEVRIVEESPYDSDHWCDVTTFKTTLILESLKGNKTYRCEYDIFC